VELTVIAPDELTEATVGALLLHAPPVVLLDAAAPLPMQRGPEIVMAEGAAYTLTVATEKPVPVV